MMLRQGPGMEWLFPYQDVPVISHQMVQPRRGLQTGPLFVGGSLHPVRGQNGASCDANGGGTYPAQDSIASANAAVARDIVSRADW